MVYETRDKNAEELLHVLWQLLGASVTQSVFSRASDPFSDGDARPVTQPGVVISLMTIIVTFSLIISFLLY